MLCCTMRFILTGIAASWFRYNYHPGGIEFWNCCRLMTTFKHKINSHSWCLSSINLKWDEMIVSTFRYAEWVKTRCLYCYPQSRTILGMVQEAQASKLIQFFWWMIARYKKKMLTKVFFKTFDRIMAKTDFSLPIYYWLLSK